MSQLYLSLTDVWERLKQEKKRLFFFALLCGLGAFCLQLRKPPVYRVEASLRCDQSGQGLSKVFLGEESALWSDPLILLPSQPVLEKVIEKEALQATFPLKRRMWETLLAEGAHLRYRLPPRPSSAILDRKVPVPDKPLFRRRSPPAELADLVYRGAWASAIQLVPTGGATFRVEGDIRGKGSVGVPFEWEGGSFVVEKLNRVASLSLIPMEQTVVSLQKRLSVRKDKRRKGVFHVALVHSDRELAVRVVNGVVGAYREFLWEEAGEKINDQLTYLAERKGALLRELGSLWEEESEGWEGERFFKLEEEIAFHEEQKRALRKRLGEVEGQIGARLPEKDLLLSLSRAQTQLKERQRELDVLEARWRIYAEELPVDEPVLQEGYAYMRGLVEKVEDEKNWTAREREQLKRELERAREALARRIEEVRGEAETKIDLLKEEIRELKGTVQHRLREEREGLKEDLAHLSSESESIHKEWKEWKERGIEERVHRKTLVALAQLIEARNSALHMEPFGAQVLKWGAPPALPRPPHLQMALLVGVVGGGCFYMLGLAALVLWKGPTASVANLRALGWHVLDDVEELPFFYEKSMKRLFVSEPFAHPLLEGREVVMGEGPKAKQVVMTREADAILYFVSDEQVADLTHLPREKTYFLVGKRTLYTRGVPLAQIVPLLKEKLSAVFMET